MRTTEFRRRRLGDDHRASFPQRRDRCVIACRATAAIRLTAHFRRHILGHEQIRDAVFGDREAVVTRSVDLVFIIGREHRLRRFRPAERIEQIVSGAVAARAANAMLYENWTDVSGLLMADPRIVDNPRPMEEVTYSEIRELSYMGASVLHDEAMAPVREVGIPVNIRNTNEPSHPGTRIVSKLSPEVVASTQIAGVAGKTSFSMITIGKNLMNREVGFVYRLLGVFEHNGIPFEHCPSSIDSVSVIVESKWLEGRSEQVLEEIRRTMEPDELDFVPSIALIAIVGEEMARTPGIAARVFTALAGAGVNVCLINQGASELNIIVGVAPDDYPQAVRAIYGAFVA